MIIKKIINKYKGGNNIDNIKNDYCYKELYLEYKRLNAEIITYKSKLATADYFDQRMYQAKLNCCERAYQDFKTQINTLKNKFKDDLELYVFEKRFLRGWSIKRIAKYLNYSISRINQIIKKIKEQMQ